MNPTATQLNLLREIEGGKRAFQANSRSEEDEKAFQPQAEELIELGEDGYLSSCAPNRETSTGRAYIDFVFVGGLTAKGRRKLQELAATERNGEESADFSCSACHNSLRPSALFCDKCGFRLTMTEDATLKMPTDKSATGTDSLIGTILRDTYQIISEIGSGAMGRVYRGRNIRLETDIAIKVIDKRHLSDASAILRFEREAKMAASIRHPNVIVIHDLGKTAQPDARLFIVMELAEGESLKAILQRARRLDLETTNVLLKQICAAVGAAHEKGVIHRDIKPDNIMVSQTGAVKVLDFGLAKLFNSPNQPAITYVGTLVGTPVYMSPEQCRVEELDSRSDVYGLATIAYEMLTGRPPFEGPDVIRQHQLDDPPHFDSHLGVPPLVEEVVMRGLSKRREDRQANATVFGEELRAAFEAVIKIRPDSDLADTVEDARSTIVDSEPAIAISGDKIDTVSKLEDYLLDPNTIKRACRLIESTVEQLAKDLAEINASPVATDQTQDGVLHLMTTYERASALAVCLYTHAANDGEPTVTEALVRGLTLVGHIPRIKNAREEPQLYSALLLTYAAGLAAVSGKRLQTAVSLLRTKIRTRTYGKGQLAAYVLNPYRIFDKQIVQSIENHHTPINKHLFTVLREPLKRVIRVDAEYDETFLLFEYLLALVSAQAHEQVWENAVAPDGSYLWESNLRQRPYVFEITDNELQRQGESWPWFKAGIFAGSFAEFLEFKKKVDESIKRDIRHKYSAIAL
ncbi:MAG TPA: serine/threonine-protein kinase [Pyrinomonadaceae bacterium]|nr:serine/threonine-protein kinase [Pyrinomonadaceae bacterium]